MEHQSTHVEIHQSGLIDGSQFGIDVESQAHVFAILRDHMYKNKIRAILREYATNAWDAHAVAGKGDVPIKVVLPTTLNPNLIVRDYGSGLSEEDIFRIYPKYGTSMKRDSNVANGYFGIGCKSAFSYSNTFMVISRHNGICSTYVALQDEGLGQFNLMHRTECDLKDTGIEINIPVHIKDVKEFEREAQYIFQFFFPTPQINCKVTPYPLDTCEALGTSNLPHNSPSNWVAIMGVVAYPLDFTDMKGEIAKAGFTSIVEKIGTGVLKFGIGDINIAASREALSYTTKTKQAIIAKLEQLTAISRSKADVFMADETKSAWEKKVFLDRFYATTHLTVAEEHKPFLTPKELWSEKDGDGNPDPKAGPKTFRIGLKNGRKFHPVKTILTSCKGIVIVNGRGSVTDGYLAVIPHNKKAIEAVRAELDGYLHTAGFEGIPISLLSDLPVEDESVTRPVNMKHKVKRFVWNGGNDGTKSKNWDMVEVMPSADDVFVILSYFEVHGGSDFERDVRLHKDLFQFLGVTGFPKIYGVKTTQAAPVSEDAVEGTQYYTWVRQTILKALAEKEEIRNMLVLVPWVTMDSQASTNWMDWTKHLPADHPLTLHLTEWHEAGKKLRSYKTSTTIQRLWNYLSPEKENGPKKKLDAILSQYPLLYNDYAPLDKARNSLNLKHWIEYITLIDENNKRKSAS